MDKINILSYDLTQDHEFYEFCSVKRQFLSLMRNAYGNRYWGDKRYMERLEKRNLIIYLAYDTTTDSTDPIATLLVKSNGKLCGLGVEKAHRNKGIATQLISIVKDRFSYLFGEIATDNKTMPKLMVKLGFKMVKDFNYIKKLLPYEPLVKLDETSSYTSYYTKTETLTIDKLRKFVIYEFQKNKI